MHNANSLATLGERQSLYFEICILHYRPFRWLTRVRTADAGSGGAGRGDYR